MKTKVPTPKDEAVAELLKLLAPGDKLFTVLRHCSASGMTRRIDVLMLDPEMGLRQISHLVGRAVGYRHDTTRGGLVVSGCGMDMGFGVVYNLGRALWPNGAASALHAADRTWTRNRNGDKGPETDGGYLLRQEWI